MPDNLLSDERLVEMLEPDETKATLLLRSERDQILAHARALAAERDRLQAEVETDRNIIAGLREEAELEINRLKEELEKPMSEDFDRLKAQKTAIQDRERQKIEKAAVDRFRLKAVEAVKVKFGRQCRTEDVVNFIQSLESD